LSAAGLVKDFFQLFFPNNCISCQSQLVRNEEIICTNCLYHLPRTNFHLREDNPVAKTFWGRVPLERATAYYYFGKGSKFRKLIHKLKYNGHREIGIFLGKHFAGELAKTGFLEDIQVIVPVPLHPAKERKRGYNQSFYIALGMSQASGIPLNTKTLLRVAESETQTRKGRFERWKNVGEIFSVKHHQTFENHHILLVDDVITTGATMEACTHTLLSIPGTRVSVAALAYAN
jgi:ComF family protein